MAEYSLNQSRSHGHPRSSFNATQENQSTFKHGTPPYKSQVLDGTCTPFPSYEQVDSRSSRSAEPHPHRAPEAQASVDTADGPDTAAGGGPVGVEVKFSKQINQPQSDSGGREILSKVRRAQLQISASHFPVLPCGQTVASIQVSTNYFWLSWHIMT